MRSAVLTANALFPAVEDGVEPSALRSLMRMWEEECVLEEEETEAELMVMLSGMVGAHAMALDE